MMGRRPCCSKEGLNRGAWLAREDKILKDYIDAHGKGKWSDLPKRAGLKRCGKSCRLRWLNYLRPDIKRGNISRDEEELIIRLHNLLGNRWSLIAGRLPGRTDNEIKNYWNTHLTKKVNSQVPIKKTNKEEMGERSDQVIRAKSVRSTKAYDVPSCLVDNSLVDGKCSELIGTERSSSVPLATFLDFQMDFDMDDFMAGIDCDSGFDQICDGEYPLRLDVASNIRTLSASLDFEDVWEKNGGKDDIMEDMGRPSCVS